MVAQLHRVRGWELAGMGSRRGDERRLDHGKDRARLVVSTVRGNGASRPSDGSPYPRPHLPAAGSHGELLSALHASAKDPTPTALLAWAGTLAFFPGFISSVFFC
ncbi:hypothetical protein ZWY2020_055558 [Hordeum vulgare]|nr:hypothetical protein ZWY2020_055558 [Hordeum vulgare]